MNNKTLILEYLVFFLSIASYNTSKEHAIGTRQYPPHLYRQHVTSKIKMHLFKTHHLATFPCVQKLKISSTIVSRSKKFRRSWQTHGLYVSEARQTFFFIFEKIIKRSSFTIEPW